MRNPLVYMFRSDYPRIVQKRQLSLKKKLIQYLVYSSKNYYNS